MTIHTLPKRNAWTILRENGLQLLMYLLGTVTIGLVWWPLGPVYLAYSILSNYLYMAWICPYCGHYALGTCAAGFDLLSGKRFKPVPGRTFGTEFRRKSWVLYPGWFLPPVAGVYLLIVHFAWPVLALLAVFCIVAFWLLPVDSRRHCEACTNVDCPRYPQHKKAPAAS
ncbi:MAG TPA: hypothetical protein VMC09_00755 [Anaerolineales bacterium]|nr:hypothetical protein [Anaerolineales bacterium]